MKATHDLRTQDDGWQVCSRCNKHWSPETPLQEIAGVACHTTYFTVGRAFFSQTPLQDGSSPGIGYVPSADVLPPRKETDEPPVTFSLSDLPVASITFSLDSEQGKTIAKWFGPFLNRDILLSHVAVYMGIDFATVDPLLKYHIPLDWMCVITHEELKTVLAYAAEICPPDRYGTFTIPQMTGRGTILVQDYSDPWCYMPRDRAKELFPEAFERGG